MPLSSKYMLYTYMAPLGELGEGLECTAWRAESVGPLRH